MNPKYIGFLLKQREFEKNEFFKLSLLFAQGFSICMAKRKNIINKP